jgi:hypothetical protein
MCGQKNPRHFFLEILAIDKKVKLFYLLQRIFLRRKKMTRNGDAERKQRRDQVAREAYTRLKRGQTYEDWRSVGEKLSDITEEVMAEQGLTQWDPNDKKLVREVAGRFEAWERQISNEPPMHKSERHNLRELMTNPIYHTWYMTLPGPERRRLNHPTAIIAKYKRAHLVKKKSDDELGGGPKLEKLIDGLLDHLHAMDLDGRRSVLERLVSPFKEELSLAEKKLSLPAAKKKKSLSRPTSRRR